MLKIQDHNYCFHGDKPHVAFPAPLPPFLAVFVSCPGHPLPRGPSLTPDMKPPGRASSPVTEPGAALWAAFLSSLLPGTQLWVERVLVFRLLQDRSPSSARCHQPTRAITLQGRGEELLGLTQHPAKARGCWSAGASLEGQSSVDREGGDV